MISMLMRMVGQGGCAAQRRQRRQIAAIGQVHQQIGMAAVRRTFDARDGWLPDFHPACLQQRQRHRPGEQHDAVGMLHRWMDVG